MHSKPNDNKQSCFVFSQESINTYNNIVIVPGKYCMPSTWPYMHTVKTIYRHLMHLYYNFECSLIKHVPRTFLDP